MMCEDVQHHARMCEPMHECARPCKGVREHVSGGKSR